MMKNRVYEIRKRKGYTLKQLAEKTGLGITTINEFENGNTSPTAYTIVNLATALGVSVDELFGEKKNKSITIKKNDYPEKTKEEYLAELQEVLLKMDVCKVRYFYIFIMAKLGVKSIVEGGVIA